MSWITVALAAYLLLAVANLLDKFLVTTVLKNGRVYAFSACILGVLVFVAAPWFLRWPGIGGFGLNIFNGFLFAAALWALYEALRRGEAARTLVIVGGLTPVFSGLISWVFFQEQFSSRQLIGIAFLLAGIFVIAALPTQRNLLARITAKLRFPASDDKGGRSIAVLSALAYALYFICTKYAYADQPFASAFIWTRLGAALAVLIFLVRRVDRQAIAAFFHRSSSKQNKMLVIANQTVGSVGFVLQNYAIFLGSVVLVNALQGAQYAFLLVISAVLAAVNPRVLKENFSWRSVLQKSAAIGLIAVGLYFLTV